MPRFLIERTYTVDLDNLPTVATRSKSIGHHRFPEIVWEHSHVVVTDDGTPKSYCVYAAPNEEMVREHSESCSETTSSSESTRSRATSPRATSRSSTTRRSRQSSGRLTSAWMMCESACAVTACRSLIDRL